MTASCADAPNRPGLVLLWRSPDGAVRITPRPVTCDRWDCGECGLLKMDQQVRALLKIVPPVQKLFTAKVPRTRVETVRRAARNRGGGRLAVALTDGHVVVVTDVDVLSLQRVRQGRRWRVGTETAETIGQGLRDPALVARVRRVDWAGAWRGRGPSDSATSGGDLLAVAWFGRGHAERRSFALQYGYDPHLLTLGGELDWAPDGGEVTRFQMDLADWHRTVGRGRKKR